MPRRFCAICGKILDDNDPHFGMCLNCYLKEHPLFELVDKISFKVCLDCGSYTRKEEWIKPIKNQIFSIIEEAIYRFLLKSYLKENNIDFFLLPNESSFIYSSKDLLISCDLTIHGTLKNDIKIKHQQTIKINLNYELCKNCSNLRGGTYFLSIMQLRVKDKTQFDLIKKILDGTNELVEKIFEKDSKQYIVKIEDQKNGVDLYLSTNELMNYIISFLRTNYHFILKRSKKLVGRDTQKGRGIYRLKTLIKFLPIKKKDIVSIENNNYIVENITRNKIVLRNKKNTKLIKDYSYFFNNKNYFLKKNLEDV